jgi:hypothetical protein
MVKLCPLSLKGLALAMLTHGDKHMGNIKVDINPKALDQSLLVKLTKKTQTNQKNMKNINMSLNLIGASVLLYTLHVVVMDWLRFVS